MSPKSNPRLATSDNANEAVAMIELGAELLDQISAGGATLAHNDEAPKETVTFEYGSMVITYGRQQSID